MLYDHVLRTMAYDAGVSVAWGLTRLHCAQPSFRVPLVALVKSLCVIARGFV